MDVNGKRATVMGLGHFGGGVAAARWLALEGARVTVTDTAGAEVLEASLEQLRDVPIEAWHLDGHRDDDFRNVDLVVVNPAVKPGNAWLALAQQSGALVITEVELFLRRCPTHVVGVTGSNGKSTTAALTAAALRAAGKPVWLGGNIGRSLLADLGAMTADDWSVLELSSAQLWHFTSDAPMPHIAVVTNCTTNHLDWHGSFDEYRRAKQRLIAEQRPTDVAVLNNLDPEVASWRPVARGEVVASADVERVPALHIPGEHNRTNAACAMAAALAAGAELVDVERGLSQFAGLPQRLEWFAMIDGRRFYDDSTATTPESTLAALESIDVPVWLLAGGRSKGFDFGPLAKAIVRRTLGAAFYGEARDELHQQVVRLSPTFRCHVTERLADALPWCLDHSKPGEAIVLSPACASTDQFRNFRERGRHFEALAASLVGQAR